MDFSEILLNIESYLSVLVISMAPIIELKGAMPIGLALGLGVWETFFTALIGSCLPVPFLILFIRKLLEWMSGCKIRFFHKFAPPNSVYTDFKSLKPLRFWACLRSWPSPCPPPGSGPAL